jgi:hypothetical protein
LKRHLARTLSIGGLVASVLFFSASAFAQSNPNATTVAGGKADTVRFGGLAFDFSISDSMGLNGVGQNYRNELNFYFEPRWDIGRKWFAGTRFRTFGIAWRFAVTQPLTGVDEGYFRGTGGLAGPQGTCGDPTINNGMLDATTVGYCNPQSNDYRTGYSDIWMTFRNPRIYTIPKLGININPSVRMFFPVSQESRYQTLQFALSPILSLSRSFWKDRLNFALGVIYTKNFHRYTSPQLSPEGGTTATQGGNPYDGIMGAGLSNMYNDPSRTGTLSGYNVSQSLLYIINGGISFNDQWSFDALYLIRNSFLYDNSCVTEMHGYTINTCDTGNAVAGSSGSYLERPGVRDAQILWLTLAYQPTDWVGLNLMWINWAPLTKPDGSFRQGIISTDYNAFTTLSLGVTFSIDRIANRIWKPGPKPLTAQTGNGLTQAKR